MQHPSEQPSQKRARDGEAVYWPGGGAAWELKGRESDARIGGIYFLLVCGCGHDSLYRLWEETLMEDPLITYTRNKFGARAGQGPITEEAWFNLLAEREQLLEAMQAIANFAVGHGDVCEIIAKRARAAIAKAKGQKLGCEHDQSDLGHVHS